jgi:hypothetical protein
MKNRVLQLDFMIKVVILLGSSTSGTTGHRLQSKILDTTGSLQWQMTRESYTPYQIKPGHSRMKRRGHQTKKN